MTGAGALDKIGYAGTLAFELMHDSADPFTVFRTCGHTDFFDHYTHDSITYMRQLEEEMGASST